MKFCKNNRNHKQIQNLKIAEIYRNIIKKAVEIVNITDKNYDVPEYVVSEISNPMSIIHTSEIRNLNFPNIC